MQNQELEAILKQTLEDRQLSRSEKKALGLVLADEGLDEQKRSWLRHRAFALATAELTDPRARHVLDWLEDVVKTLAADEVVPGAKAPGRGIACFSPGTDCLQKIVELIGRARRTLDVCVFTITDDRIANALYEAHQRRVKVRIISDNDKSGDEGSDVLRLGRAGIEVRLDRTEYHMHHKFALFDDELLLTGSYNWTRGAASYNEENLVVLSERALIAQFREEFDRLWKRL